MVTLLSLGKISHLLLGNYMIYFIQSMHVRDHELHGEGLHDLQRYTVLPSRPIIICMFYPEII